MSYVDPNQAPPDESGNWLFDIDHAATDRALTDESNQFAGGLDDPQTAAAVLDESGANTRHSALTPDTGDGFTNDTSNPANFPAAGASRTAIDTTSPAGQQPPGGGTPYVPTNQEQGTPPFGNIGFSPTTNDLATLNSFRNPDQKPNPQSFTTSPYPGGAAPAGVSNLPGASGPNNYITSLLDQKPTGPGGGTAAAGGGLPPEYANDPWARAFFAREGYFDPRFNTADSIRQELQRGGTANLAQAEALRGINPNIDALVDAIKRTPDYFQGANTQNWIGQHNNQITGDVNAGVYGKNQAAIGNVLNQRVAPLANPVDQYHAELTGAMQKTLVDSLVSLGVNPQSITTGFDSYGNAKIGYTSKSGTPEVVNATFVDLANAIETLRQRAAQTQAAAAPPGGGGSPPHNGYNPRGGGYGPPGGGGPPAGNQRPPPMVFEGGRPVPTGLGGYPTAVQSAYAFSPAITPGGFSPYDEPQGFHPGPGSMTGGTPPQAQNLGATVANFGAPPGNNQSQNLGATVANWTMPQGNTNPGGPPDEWVDENGIRHSTSGGY